MKDLSKIRVSENIDSYMRDRGSGERYASFDYCFNYFKEYWEEERIECLSSPENIQPSCVQLGFYLASWGMLRPSTILFNKSARILKPVVEAIARCDPRLWQIDLPYTDDDIKRLLCVGVDLCNALGGKASDTLVTKIMLGVFANVPAMDSYFKTAFGIGHFKGADGKPNAFNETCLKRVSQFYKDRKAEIDGYLPIYTFDFDSEAETSRRYAKAKIVDMIGWVEGERILAAKGKANEAAS